MARARLPVLDPPLEAAQRPLAGAGGLGIDLVRTARPQQWAKNLLLYAGFIFSARTEWSWRQPDEWMPLLLMATAGFIVFNVLSSGTYFINDAVDAEADQRHPRKRLRPVAAGRISPRNAWLIGVTLLTAGACAALLIEASFALAALAYVLITLAYSLLLKQLVIVDVLAVATGFALRGIAGALIIGVPISPWLYVCTTLGALFIAAMKRRQEVMLLDGAAASHRAVLGEYSVPVLDQMASVALAATIVAYSLYTTTAENLPANHSMLFTLPWVLYGLFRFRLLADRQPERNADELIAHDLPLLVAIVGFGLTALVVLAFDR